jgi:hypothetical protein
MEPLKYKVSIPHLLGIDIDTGIGWLDGALGLATLIITLAAIVWLGRRLGRARLEKTLKQHENKIQAETVKSVDDPRTDCRNAKARTRVAAD